MRRAGFLAFVSLGVEEIRRRRGFGADLPILNLPTNMPWEVVEQFIRAMAPRA